ncbi:MAG: hypothetical protein JNK14_04220 [Chitinophagaceae bacterium]|nr:hypothetical protein [Chitinophagaceae bacterium]
MSTRLIVDSANQLKELNENDLSQTPVIRLAAKVISYVFHPIFVPLYIVLFLLYVHPAVFAGFSPRRKTLVLLQAAGMYGLFPLVTILLLKALNFIDSIFLRSQKDRIIPYIACGIWYFWLWYVWKNLPDYPKEVIILSLAIFLASVAGLMANIYMKISMHSIAIGVMLAFISMLGLTQSASFGLFVSLAFLVAGLVCTARLIVSDHSQKEIYAGLFAGLLSLVIAAWFS